MARGPLSAEQRRKLSAGKTGERNPNWKHGKRADQASRAFSLSAKGDEVACRNCGAVGKLHLHHIIPRSMYRAGRDEIRNGVPLCPSCHIGWHRRTVTLCRDIFTGEEWSYVSSAELLGQSVTAWLDDRYPLRRITNERQAA